MPRARSCASCVKAKARCDNGRPACSRCSIKRINCTYQGSIPVAGTKSAQRSRDEQNKQSAVTYMPNSFNTQYSLNSCNDYGNVVYDSLLGYGHPNENNEVVDTRQHRWENFDWDSLSGSQLSSELVQNPGAFLQTSLDGGNSLPLEETFLWHRAITPAKIHIPNTPAFNMPAITQRQPVNIGTERISQLMLQTLKSYPLMMIRQKTPPPFLHPRLVVSSELDDSMESWHNCMSLVYMISGKIGGSRKLFWRNVRMECERFCEQVRPICFIVFDECSA